MTTDPRQLPLTAEQEHEAKLAERDRKLEGPLTLVGPLGGVKKGEED